MLVFPVSICITNYSLSSNPACQFSCSPFPRDTSRTVAGRIDVWLSCKLLTKAVYMVDGRGRSSIRRGVGVDAGGLTSFWSCGGHRCRKRIFRARFLFSPRVRARGFTGDDVVYRISGLNNHNWLRGSDGKNVGSAYHPHAQEVTARRINIPTRHQFSEILRHYCGHRDTPQTFSLLSFPSTQATARSQEERRNTSPMHLLISVQGLIP